MLKRVVLLLFILLPVYAAPPLSFNQAKKIASALFKKHPETLYCHCDFNNKEIDLASCGLDVAEPIARAHRLEWEHMMAAEHFGQHFSCWREPLCHDSRGKPFKGRRCCEKISPEFNQAEAELYNLWPAVGLINQLRSNYRFAQLSQKKASFGCAFYVDKAGRKAEPDDKAKGVVARANLFMQYHYGIPLSPSQEKLFLAWSRQYPATAWEKQWAKEVARIEGYSNPFIEDPE
ncbi:MULTISPECIES: endonuclease [Legionella]|uniref:endonuclease n=1 Tax=Legionella TaxID=445 RepID=UPI0010413B60|nr:MULTISPECIES: endonuclease [Legionella]